MTLTSKSVREMQLAMARMMRDKARENGDTEIASMDLEDIIELHTEALRRMGYVLKKLPH